MMEFLAGFGIGLCIGIVGTVAAIIWMRDRGYQIVRTDKLTGREAEELGKALETLQAEDKTLKERLDAVNDILDEQAMRIREHDNLVHEDHERLGKVVDIVTLDKEGE